MKVFMIGTQRSGSNLLRLMLNQAPNIAAPHPPHLLERFMPLLPGYGSLANEDHFAGLIDDVLRMVECNPVPWDVGFDRREIRQRCRENSLVALFGAVMDHMAEARGKAHWLCKSLANVHFLPEIERCFGAEARYLYLYRDGRDVCLSFLKAVVGEKTAYHVAKQWAQEQQLALACGTRVPASQFLALSYEELTSNAESTLRLLCRWLDIEFQPSMLAFHQSEEASKTADSGQMWSNVRRPVMASNTQKWRKGLTPDQIIDFESVAGAALTQLGYGLEWVGKEAPRRRYSEATVNALEAENRQLKAAARQDLSASDAEARRPQEELMAALRARRVLA